MRKRTMLWKEVGETPLMAVARYKKDHPQYEGVPMSYAGRLDPMAEGKLLVLVGDECKRQDHYRGLDKEYEIEVVLDVGSDTGDVLGIASYVGKETHIDTSTLRKVLRSEEGAHTRAYPAYSSKTVKGKPLFLYALEGTLSTINIPTHTETIYSISYKDTTMISRDALRARVGRYLQKVPISDEPSKVLGADFRIKAVRESWDRLFEEAGERTFVVLRLRIVCGGGTYMRTLAPRIGEALHTNALTLSITRTKIGRRMFGFLFQIPS